MRNKKRVSYKRETQEQSSENIKVIDPFLIQCIKKETNELFVYDIRELKKFNCGEINLIVAKFIQEKYASYKGIRGKKAIHKRMLSFFEDQKITFINQINYEELIRYKFFISEIPNLKIKTQKSNYSELLLLMQYAMLNNYKVHDDIKKGDYPENFKNRTESSIEKNLKKADSYNDSEYLILLESCIGIIKDKKSNHHDKITAYLVVLSLLSGANSSVLLSFTDLDLIELSKEKKFYEIIKYKGRKGSDVKIVFKNYELFNSNLSELSNIILKSKKKFYSEYKNEPFEDYLFIYPRLLKGKPTNKWSLLNNNASLGQVKRMFVRYKIEIKNDFNFTKARKYVERKINKISGDVSITSTLMGHSIKTANKHYLDVVASEEQHQKLALTQDTLKGFSKNSETNNFIVYQKLLGLYDMDLSTALDLANKGFEIKDIINKSKKA